MFGLNISLVLWGLLYAMILGSCGLALWKGGPPERLGGGLILAFVLLWELTRFLPHNLHAFLPVAQLIGDGLTALGLLAIAVRYGSLWLGGALLFQAAQFSLHSFYLVTNRAPDALHMTVNNADLLAILSCLLLGSLTAWRRRARAERLARPQANTVAPQAPGTSPSR
jgi:hypothetical protein